MVGFVVRDVYSNLNSNLGYVGVHVNTWLRGLE